MTPALKEAAKTINRLARQEEDTRRQLCIAIAGAMDLVKRESNLSWKEWADENLRKPDGTKWAINTLYSYASYGRDPKRLDNAREVVKNNGRRARKALRIIRHETIIPPSSPPKLPLAIQSQPDKELQYLIKVWSQCSPQTKRRFLEYVRNEVRGVKR